MSLGQFPASTSVGQVPASTSVGQVPASTSVGQIPGSFVKGRTEDEIHAKEGAKLRTDLTFKGIANLLWINQNTVYKIALDEWEQTAKLLSERVDRMEKRSGDLKNEIYQLAGFFSVFQGVVLTAVTQLAQSNDEYHNCKKVWSPVILTALAWVVATVGVWQKMSRIQKLDELCEDEDKARRVAVQRAQALKNQGSAFKFSDIVEQTRSTQAKLLWGLPRSFWIKRFGVVFATMSVFTGIFIGSYFLILCNRGEAPI